MSDHETTARPGFEVFDSGRVEEVLGDCRRGRR